MNPKIIAVDFDSTLCKNKICALILITIAILTTIITQDITFLVFSLIMGIPLFLSKENWIK